MAAPPAYPSEPSAGYPAQPGYSGGYPGQGYDQADKQPSYPSQPGYPQQPPGYQPYPGPPPPGYQPTTASNTAATVIIAEQPAVVTEVQPGIRPNNYMVLSIVNLLFCFFVLGLIALIFSLQVDSAWSSGRYEEARRNSNNARTLNYVGIGVGIVGWVIVGIIVVVRIVLSFAFCC